MHKALQTLFFTCTLGSIATAQATLTVSPDSLPIGTPIEYCLEAPAGSTLVLFASLSAGPSVTPFGVLDVDIATAAVFVFPIVDSKLFQDCLIPCDDSLVGLVGHFQFLAFPPSGGVLISNKETVTVTDGDCSVDDSGFQSYTQGGWGQECNGDNVGCLRDTHFASVLPSGLLLGDQSGNTGDTNYSLLLTSAAAVEAFLPAGSTAGVLDADLINPTTSSAGVFAGQLAAAKLNVAFDAAGLFDDTKAAGAPPLSDLVFIANVSPAFFGMCVIQVIELADQVISGEVETPVEVNGIPVTITDISHALDKVNNNFGDGTKNEGTLGLPE